ncbi:hypothetical protein E1301_Tti012148 [Triplophysa tibetana]|uniref:Uncharacterized protein n=1 Tax=Triplophysa tibetana TaxID=1572043 RepID=A0A5A9P628_9TELE|nr:hypothetical protein E1301_Tti012148 [Triplophysa tibetana]
MHPSVAPGDRTPGGLKIMDKDVLALKSLRFCLARFRSLSCQSLSLEPAEILSHVDTRPVRRILQHPFLAKGGPPHKLNFLQSHIRTRNAGGHRRWICGPTDPRESQVFYHKLTASQQTSRSVVKDFLPAIVTGAFDLSVFVALLAEL